ncbi:hypothetical protein CAEBREN_05445 [Caenorhabditis brenneri]|uniref:Bromo domain-containing protein n=1 Tax=Caenorhabditis brenneri TaxID=135651 RepID=G0PLQ4_CAEBE|nr:hypothetical protein CAEBREN_05445 [Caenorhabditis brenneri]
MKQREVLDNRRRQLTYFTSCNAGTCNCRGFRPVINNEDETVERRASRAERENEYAPMTRDLEILRCEEVIECRFCGHSITFHAEPLKNISEEELDTYMDRISDLQLCCAELTEIDPGNESLQTIYTTMQVLLKSLRTLKPIEVPHMGKPNFEPESLSSYLSVKKFIATRPVDNSEKQRLAEIGTLFLTEMNYWKLEGYQKLAECWFSDKLEINQPVYQGWIKEYEGATLMGCHLHPQISYTKFPDFSRGIQALHCGYKLENGCESRGKVYDSPPLLAVSRIPGTDSLKMSKKSCYQLDERDDHLETKAASILKKLNADKNAWPFANPVDKKEVPEYYDFTKHPIDLKTMHEKLKRKSYHHQHLFIADLTRMFQNCYSFNASNTVYYKMAYKLNEYALKLLKSSFPDSTFYPDLPSQKPN